jgi:hypothetical protein
MRPMIYDTPPVDKDVLCIVQKIWRTRKIPGDWAATFVVILQKSDVLDDPIEFLVKNNFIKRTIQKGFPFGVSGCVGHIFSLLEALHDAKENQRTIVCT